MAEPESLEERKQSLREEIEVTHPDELKAWARELEAWLDYRDCYDPDAVAIREMELAVVRERLAEIEETGMENIYPER